MRTEQEGCNQSSTKNTKNGKEQEDNSSTQNETEWDGTEREQNDKKEEQEWNNLAEGPCSRTERNDFKKVGTCPALLVAHCFFVTIYLYISLHLQHIFVLLSIPHH